MLDSETMFASLLIVVWIVYYTVIFAIGIASFVFMGLGIMGIAKRRGFENPWIAFIPFANTFLLGKITDSVEKKQGKKTKYGVFLLTMEIILSVAVIPFFVISTMFFATTAFSMSYDYYSPYSTLTPVFLTIFIISLIIFLGAIIWLCVIEYIALYKIYKAYAPSQAVLFIVLNILISISKPVILFMLRKAEDKSIIPQQTPTDHGIPASSPQIETQQPVDSNV